jgi:hypothetical protein
MWQAQGSENMGLMDQLKQGFDKVDDKLGTVVDGGRAEVDINKEEVKIVENTRDIGKKMVEAMDNGLNVEDESIKELYNKILESRKKIEELKGQQEEYKKKLNE